MSDEEGTKTVEAGKTANQQYDIDAAIATVRGLGQAQQRLQSRRLHPYRLEWLDQLEERYRRHPGKTSIHLSDLPAGNAIRVSETGVQKLRDLWTSLQIRYTNKEIRKMGLDGIYGYAIRRYYSHITLNTLRRVPIEDWSVDSLEPYVTNIKSHKNNWPKDVQPKQLPFDFLNEDGAAIMAYYTDSKHATCAFTNKDLELHDLMKRAVEKVVGSIESHTRTYPDISETYWSLFLRNLVTIAGIDTNPRQKVADNPVPLWLFTAPKNVQSAYLRALWSAEGNVKSMMRLTQAKAMPELAPHASNIAKHWEKDPTTFNELPNTARELVRAKPSMLLISATLLHISLGLDIGLRPITAYIDHRNEPTIQWAIEITSNEEIQKFSELVNFDSTRKRTELSNRLQKAT
jgi:hypothetical protein